MNGRLFMIKKTTLQRLSFVVNFCLFVVISTLLVVINKNYNAWFFCFCAFSGLHLILKSALYYLDSSLYFGSILLCLGGFYFLVEFLKIEFSYPFFILLSFSIASYLVFTFFKQSFQLILSFSLILASVFTLLFIIQIISLGIFLALLSVVVLLLVCGYFSLN